jgi:hypothetical protein
VPGQTYTVTVKHLSGASIVNFNVTTRVGTTNVVAGTFSPVLNSALYIGADGGVFASPHAIDSAVFQWTAPQSGTGVVTLYGAAFQGSTSSSNGQSKSLSTTSTESLTSINEPPSTPTEFLLEQNYPNPFNPITNIRIYIGSPEFVELKVYSPLGEELTTLISENKAAGVYSIPWNALPFPSGAYFCRLRTDRFVATQKMLLVK